MIIQMTESNVERSVITGVSFSPPLEGRHNGYPAVSSRVINGKTNLPNRWYLLYHLQQKKFLPLPGTADESHGV